MKVINAICDLIEAHGKITLKDLAEAAEKDPQLVGSTITGHRNKPFVCESRRIRIVGWGKSGPRHCAIYAIGDEPDVAYSGATEARALDRAFRARDLIEIDAALKVRIDALRTYQGNPFAVAMAQCEVRA